jgi:hypothetical protein
MRLSATSLLVLALLALGGCSRGAQPPVEVYKDFHAKVQKQQYKEAYGALSKPTQDAIEARVQKLKEVSGGTLKDEPFEVFFANSVPPTDVTEVTLVSEEGDVATVRVLSSGNSREVRMVREASGWKIDLSDSLKP